MTHPTHAGAVFSEDKKYRYVLWRKWKSHLPTVAYIGLNPSTANEKENDNTIKKLIKITDNNGYGGFYMLNLFGIISSEPEILLNHPDPLGDNDDHLKRILQEVYTVVACWGCFKEAYSTGRAQKMLEMLKLWKTLSIGNGLYCLAKTKHGNPKHPLYCRDTQEFLKF